MKPTGSAPGRDKCYFPTSAVLLALFVATSAPENAAAQAQRNLLGGTFGVESLRAVLLPAHRWHPFPRVDERRRWLALREEVRAACLRRGEGFRGGPWVTPTATEFLEYVRNGNRSKYERTLFSRRSQLAELVLAECMEAKGRFLDDIVNGIWSTCEETYWGVPAHLGAQKKGAGLPDVTEPTVDLFAAETGALLAWTSYLLGDSLDALSPLVRERVRHEVERRIIAVNLERDDSWWMGFSRQVNNWNPWICSNWLACVLLLERDEDRRVRSVHKILRCLDNFLNAYPDDGGCDEGPGYWGRAGGSLFDCLELLRSASEGRIDLFPNPLVKEIGRYIMRAHIAGDYYVNFADAAAKASPDASVIFRYGGSIGDSAMTRFGAFLATRERLDREPPRGQFGGLGRVLPALFSLDEMLRTPPLEPLLRDSWLPGVQVMTARSFDGSSRGFYLAVQGGHNAESHNHNDVGNFIVYYNGEPVLIDAGVETYTAKTFSGERYSIWTMQSAYHNLPSINGSMQREGREYAAANVRYRADDSSASLSMDIAGAYPAEAKVARWDRAVTLVRGRDVTVTDSYELTEVRGEVRLSFMTRGTPNLEKEGRITLGNGARPHALHRLALLYDRGTWGAAVEPVLVEDETLRASWGERIYRIVLTMRGTPKKGIFAVRVVDR